MTKKKDPGALAGATGAGGHQVCGEELLDTTNGRTGPASHEPLAAVRSYQLLAWEPCERATGRVWHRDCALAERKAWRLRHLQPRAAIRRVVAYGNPAARSETRPPRA
jgi:hypothetical protein